MPTRAGFGRTGAGLADTAWAGPEAEAPGTTLARVAAAKDTFPSAPTVTADDDMSNGRPALWFSTAPG